VQGDVDCSRRSDVFADVVAGQVQDASFKLFTTTNVTM
jgi:hypothetical protein